MMKKTMVGGILFVSILGSLMHFFYDWSGQNPIVGLFAPVNESVWEHIKLLFFPMLLYLLLFCRGGLRENPRFLSGYLYGTLAGSLLIPILFYAYTAFLGHSVLAIDLAIYFISVLFSFVVAGSLATGEKQKQGIFLPLALCLILGVCFFVFTYFPPNLPLFQTP